MHTNYLKKTGILALILNFFFATFPATSYAGLIGTEEMLTAEARSLHMAGIESTLARDDVRAQMLEMGVDPAQVEERLSALTDAQLAQLAAEMNQLPAGSGVIEVVGIVFVVLLILELLDVTDVFTGV